MRIGILTQPLRTNYGGILQAYALQTVLAQMGHQTVVFNKVHHLKLPYWKMPFSYTKRIIKKILLGKKEDKIFFEQWCNKTYLIISQHTQKFINNYIHQYIINDFSQLKKDEFDAIVVGSDQIWRPSYNLPIEHSFLDFATNWNIIRVAYAASFGTSEWEFTKKQTENCKNLIKYFDAVSVREDGGVKLCKTMFEVTAEHVLDPTLLLDRDAYIQLIKAVSSESRKGNLLIYMLDETKEKSDIIHKITSTKKFVPFTTNSKVENYHAPTEERIQPPVEHWIKGFYDADFVVTDSFHGCVFSIIFNKPFIVCENIERGNNRIESLLKIFELEHRLVSSIEMVNSTLINTDIDWDKINSIKYRWQKKSIDFLNNILNSKK